MTILLWLNYTICYVSSVTDKIINYCLNEGKIEKMYDCSFLGISGNNNYCGILGGKDYVKCFWQK